MDSEIFRSVGIMMTGTYGMIFFFTWVAEGWPLGHQDQGEFKTLIRRGWVAVPLGLMLVTGSAVA